LCCLPAHRPALISNTPTRVIENFLSTPDEIKERHAFLDERPPGGYVVLGWALTEQQLCEWAADLACKRPDENLDFEMNFLTAVSYVETLALAEIDAHIYACHRKDGSRANLFVGLARRTEYEGTWRSYHQISAKDYSDDQEDGSDNDPIKEYLSTSGCPKPELATGFMYFDDEWW
jgi:hypothetical protein